ncbi:hypothetical protein SCL_1836 [Sulfuricaulis limicola]|uniref:Uncharacterized protein n=1 Tax=Sulfuricaulis limicola TaxID=1620215 RepID=A0A1B4XH45_9GAMM|nr:hypothetical protein SCL_1836 [Sulfuricaulis limicola]
MEDRVLQGPGFKQGLLALELGETLRRACGGLANGGIVDSQGHGHSVNARISLADRVAEGVGGTSPAYTFICMKERMFLPAGAVGDEFVDES